MKRLTSLADLPSCWRPGAGGNDAFGLGSLGAGEERRGAGRETRDTSEQAHTHTNTHTHTQPVL